MEKINWLHSGECTLGKDEMRSSRNDLMIILSLDDVKFLNRAPS